MYQFTSEYKDEHINRCLQADYDIDEFGNVMRVAGGKGARKGRVLKPRPLGAGYLGVWLCHQGECRFVKRSRVQAIKIFGLEAVVDKEAIHLNQDKHDDSASNIRPMNQREHRRYDAQWKFKHTNRRICCLCGTDGGCMNRSGSTPRRYNAFRFGYTQGDWLCRRCYESLLRSACRKAA